MTGPHREQKHSHSHLSLQLTSHACFGTVGGNDKTTIPNIWTTYRILLSSFPIGLYFCFCCELSWIKADTSFSIWSILHTIKKKTKKKTRKVTISNENYKMYKNETWFSLIADIHRTRWHLVSHLFPERCLLSFLVLLHLLQPRCLFWRRNELGNSTISLYEMELYFNHTLF